MACRSDTPPVAPDLQRAGLRRTVQREAILQVLEVSDRPLSVEDIRLRMTGRRPGIPTIYRNLERFAREGWAEALVGADQVMRFVRCRSVHHHHHLVCEICGRAVEVESCGLLGSLEGIERSTGFRLTRHVVNLFGACPECQRNGA